MGCRRRRCAVPFWAAPSCLRVVWAFGSTRTPATPSRQTRPLVLVLLRCPVARLAQTESGWELVQAMLSEDRGARAFAAELLARTEDGRLLVRDLRRTRSGLHQLTRISEKPIKVELANGEAEPMNTPYGLRMVENCVTCPLRKSSWFCGLSPDLLKSFSGFSHLTTYPGGAILFVEGQMSRGAFVLCSGKVKFVHHFERRQGPGSKIGRTW